MVKNLVSSNGNAVPNQFEIRLSNGNRYFQSYQSVVACRRDGKYYVSQLWDYSRTTSKYLYRWFEQCGKSDLYDRNEVRKAIENGSIELVNVNSLQMI